MRLGAAKWTSGRVTSIRASSLWNDVPPGGTESPKNKFNRLFNELREEALAPTPAETREARRSALPLIDERYNEARTALTNLLNTWVDGKDDQYRQTGAYDPTTGQLYKDYADGEAAHKAYAQLLDDKITDYYRAAKTAYDAAVAAGGYKAGKGWTISSWEAEQAINARRGQFMSYALLWMAPGRAEIAIQKPQRDYEKLVRSQVGRTVDSAAAWAALEKSYFQAALDEIINIGQHMPRKSDIDKTIPIPPELKAAQEALAARPKVIVKGQFLPMLSMPCSEVQATLDALDSIFYSVAKNPTLAKIYHDVYQQYSNYWDLRCDAPATPPAVKPRYERKVIFTTKTFPAMLRAYLDGYWKSISTWPAIEEAAARLGRSQELATDKANAYNELLEAIQKVKDDPWSGPLGRDQSGRIVPYAGLDIGEALYKDWIATLAYEAYKEIRDKYLHGNLPKKAETYKPTQSFADALIATYKNTWNNDPMYGIALEPDYIRASVIDPHWQRFVDYVNSKVGSTYLSGDDFKKDVDREYAAQVKAVRDEADKLRAVTGGAFPERLAEIEEIVKDLGRSGYTPEDARNLLAEVKLLHSQVPWRADLQERYDAIYKALEDYISPRGGMTVVPYRSDTHEYFLNEKSKFLNDTKYDKDVAGWLGMDYDSQEKAWERDVWSGLTDLEKQTNLTQYQYLTAQAKVINDATNAYLRWRGSLIDTARARLTSLIDRLRSGSATQADRDLAEKASNLAHPFLQKEIEELKVALQQTLPGAVLPAALKPFMKFEPLKSTSGFDVEEFSFKHMDKFIKNWAEGRIKDGIYVDPKINGYRCVMESDGKDVRIYLEGTDKDYSRIYPHLTAELKTLPPVILDGELIERVHGKVTPRSELGKFRRAVVDDSNIYVQVFDILYLEGEDLHEKPYEERLKIRNQFFAGRNFKHLHDLPSWRVNTLPDLLARTKEAADYPGSEGAMFKTADSKYILGRRTGDWAKIKQTSDLQVMVLGKKKTKGGDYVYRGGVVVRDTKGIDPSEIETYGAKKYVVLGDTFRTPADVKVGDHLEVAVTEVVEQEGPKGKKYNWMLPKPKGITTRPVDTLEYARQVGQLLQASMMRPWQLITGILNEALSTTSVPRLRALKAQLFDALADINNARVANFCWNAIQLIRGRLGQAADPAVTSHGVEKIYEVKTTPLITDAMVNEVQDRFTALTEDIQASPQQKARDALQLSSILRGYARIAKEPILTRVNELKADIDNFIKSMDKSGTQSIIDIDRKLSELERELDDVIRTQPDTFTSDVSRIKSALMELVNSMGPLKDYFQDRLDAIMGKLDTIEIPSIGTSNVRDWLQAERMMILSTIAGLKNGDPESRQAIDVTIPAEIDGVWNRLTKAQKAIFKDAFDRLRESVEQAQKMYQNVGGALLYTATAPLKLDLGCGENKEPGFVGIDKQALPGVDKVWDLEKGIPYPDNSAAVVRARHALEHLSDPIKIMTEIWRVLKDGGLLYFEIPSTKGEGAHADPTHKSFWNKLSFAFYTDDKLRETHGIPCKYDLLSIEEEEDPATGAVYVRGILKARKSGRYAPKTDALISSTPATLDGLYIVRRHANLISTGQKKMVVKSRELPIAGHKMYLVSGNDVLGIIELGDPAVIDLEEFERLRPKHKITETERKQWWPGKDRFYAYPIVHFTAFEPTKHYAHKQGVQTIQKDVLPGAKLTSEGEQGGEERLDFMEKKPIQIPVPGVLWTHVKGINPENRLLDYDEMMKIPLKKDVLSLHHDMRFHWYPKYLDGITVFLGNQTDKDKLLKYRGGKLGTTIKLEEPIIWNSMEDLNNRLFPPHSVGNVAGKDTWGKMFYIDDVMMLPSRIRPRPKGKRYFEFYLKFKKHPELNGHWAMSEEAGKGYDIPFMMWKMKDLTPFWLRESKKHEDEIKSMPDWQRPTIAEIEKFLGVKVSAAVYMEEA